MDYGIEGFRAAAPRWRTRVAWFCAGMVVGWWIAMLMGVALGV